MPVRSSPNPFCAAMAGIACARMDTTDIFLSQFDSTLADFAREMHHSMQRYQGIGLAASQVGILRRVIVADIGDGPVTVVNPEIIDRTGFDVMPEGCLSLPEISIDDARGLGGAVC